MILDISDKLDTLNTLDTSDTINTIKILCRFTIKTYRLAMLFRLYVNTTKYSTI